ncbi:MAG: flippase-like domain-containing protein [FCB group bacterium]|nr:flippase-like domain-containing protein [FCB group bacterium]
MFWKKKQFWGTLIAIALLAYCVKDIKLSEIKELYQRIDIIYIVPSIFFTFLLLVSKSLRWRLMVSQHKAIKYIRVITLYAAGQILNIVMPALTGQVGRMFLFSKNEDLKKTFVFSTFVLEVLFDSISFIVFLFITSFAFVFPEKYRSLGYIISGATIFLLVVLYLALHHQDNIESFSRRHLRERHPSLYIGIKKFVRSFIQGIKLLRSSQHFIGSLFYSLLAWTSSTVGHLFSVQVFWITIAIRCRGYHNVNKYFGGNDSYYAGKCRHF